MNRFSTPKPSVLQLLKGKKSVLLSGCGGGGDIMQTLSLLNLCKSMGVERVVLAELACMWWEFGGQMALGGEAMELDWVQPHEKVGEYACLLSGDSSVTGGFGRGNHLHANLIKQVVPDVPVALVTIRRGTPGVLQGFRDLIDRFACELFITCDTGADAFFTGTETQVQSPLCDAYSILAASELEIPGVYGVVGFGGDAELPLQDLIKNMGLVMKKGGYLGAHGLTQEDLALIGQVLRFIPYEEVEKWPYEAARGNLGIHYCKRLWSVDITPAAAVTFFFDADTMRQVNPLVNAVRNTETLQQAEELLMKDWNLFAETRLPLTIAAPSAPQVPD